MDATQIIILTSIVNIIISGPVGGIVIYTLQMKIDATIQKSLFEHQTKFSSIHLKRVETLETLYQKFVIIADGFYDILNETHTIDRAPISFAKFQNVARELNDFWKYLVNNRLFLPANTSNEIDDMYIWAVRVLNIMSPAIFPPPTKVTRMALALTNYNIEAFNLEVSSLDLENPDFNAFADSIRNAISTQIETLEKLYKSVAEAQ